MPTSRLSIQGSQIPPWIIKGSVSPWKERLHLFYCCIINKELVKYLLLVRKSSKGRSRLHRLLGWKEMEGPWGLTYIPHPNHVESLWSRDTAGAQLHSWHAVVCWHYPANKQLELNMSSNQTSIHQGRIYRAG